MDTYAIEEMVHERQAELRRQRHLALDRAAPAAWRQRTGRALASLAVAVAVPRPQRPTIRCRVAAALSLGPPQ